MSPPGLGGPVRQDTAQIAIGAVFGLCGAIAVFAFYPNALMWAAGAGVAAAALGWLLGWLPYKIAGR
jgi:hypothetical protein